MYSQQPQKIAPPKPVDDDPEIDLDQWDDIVADKYKVPKSLMKAIRTQESGGNVNAVSPTGVKGRYQVTEKTAKSYGLDRNDPFQQSVAAAKHLRTLYDSTPGDDDDTRWLGASAKYYGGDNAVNGDEVSTDSLDGLSNPSRYVEGIAKKWGEIRRQERGGQQPGPSSPRLPVSPSPRPPIASRQPPTRNVFNQNLERDQRAATTQAKSALDFRPAGGNVVRLEEQANRISRQISPEVRQQVNARDARLQAQRQQAAQRGVIGQRARDVYQGVANLGQQAQQGFENLLTFSGARDVAEMSPAVKAQMQQGKLAREATNQKMAEEQMANDSMASQLTRGTAQAVGGTAMLAPVAMTTGIPGVMAATGLQQDWENDPTGAVVNTATAGIPLKLAQKASPLIGQVAQRVRPSLQPLVQRGTEAAVGGVTGAGQYAATQKALGREVNPEELLVQGVTNAGLGATMVPNLRQMQGQQALRRIQSEAQTWQPKPVPPTEPLTPPPAQQPNAPVAAAPIAPVEGAPDRATYDPGAMGDFEYRRDLADFQRQQARAARKAPAAAKPVYDPSTYRGAIDDAKIQAGEAEQGGNWDAARDQYRSAMDTITEMQKEARRNKDGAALTELAREKSALNTNWQMAKRNAERGAKVGTKLAPESPQVQPTQPVKPDILPDVNAPTRPLSGELPAAREAVPQTAKPASGLPRTTQEIPRVQRPEAPMVDPSTVKESLTVEPPANESAVDRLRRLRAEQQVRPVQSAPLPEVPTVRTPQVETPQGESRVDRLKRIAQEVNRKFVEPEPTTPPVESAPQPAVKAPEARPKTPVAPTAEPKLSNRVIKQSLQEEMGATSTNRSDKLRLSGPSDNYREVVTKWDDAPEGTVFKKPEHYGDEANVLFDRRLEDRKTTQGENATFFMEAQSDWHQSKDAPPAPLKNTWLRRALDDTAREASEAGQDGVLLPKTVEQLYEIQRWGAVKEKDGRYTNSEGFDITPVVRRYLKELPDLAKKAANKNGVALETRTVDDGRGGTQELWFLPVKKAAKPAEIAKAPDAETDAKIRAAAREYGQRPVEDPQYTEAPPEQRDLGRRITPFRPPTPAGPRIVGNRPTPKDVNINARFPSARRAMAAAGAGVQAEIDAGRGDTGQYGRNAQQMFKSSSGKALHGQDSFFHDPEVKGKLGLSRDAEQKDVRAAVKRQLARLLRIKADEVSLTQVAPDVWRKFADVKALSKDARAKMELAFMRAEGESSATKTANPNPEESKQPQAEPRQTTAADQSARSAVDKAKAPDVAKDTGGDRAKVGDYFTFTEPAIVYEAGQPKTIQKKVRGRVVAIKPDGSIELKRQDGGYSTKTPSELGISGDVVTPPSVEAAPVDKTAARPRKIKTEPASMADPEGLRRGVRRATPEGAAKVEAARQAMEDAIRRSDYTKPGERADTIAAAREAVQEAQAEVHFEGMRAARERAKVKSVADQLAAVDEELAAGVINDKQAKAKREAIERRNAPKSAVREFIADEGGSASLGLGLENVGKVLRKVRDAQSFGEIPLAQRRANLLTWHKGADRRLKAADGTPKTVYHGTPSAREITEFQKDKADLSGWLAGFFFTENPKVASEIYSVHGRMASEDNPATKPGATYPVHLNIKRPFDFDAPIDDATHDKLTAAADKVLGDGAGQGLELWLDRYGNNGGGPNHTLVKYVESVLGRKGQAKRGLALTRLLKTAGYDGGTHMGANDANVGNEKPHRAWISFEPAQIKSAIGNRGTFSPETGDITTMFGGQKILDNLRAGRRPQKKKEFPPDFDSTKWMKKALTDFGKQKLSDEDKAKLADPKLTDVERRKILMSAKVDPQAEAALLTHLTDALNAADTGDYTAFQDAALRAKAIYDAPATNWEKASAVRKAAMLSRPVSHLRNVIGNTAFLNLEEAARVPGSIGDMMMSGITGRRTLQGASAGDSVRAIYESATGGVQAAKDAMRGRSNEEIAKALQTKEVHFYNKIVDKSVKFIFRSLGAEDQFFFVGAYDRAIRESAKLTARNEARQGIIKRTDIKARQDALLAAPTSQMEIDATLTAETAVFRNDNPISSAISRAREGASDKANFALDLVLPFDRTPTNVVLRALEYSPIGLARGVVKGAAGSVRAARASYKAKKAGTPSRADIQATIDKAFTPAQQRSASQLFGRGLTGTGLMALGYALAEKGLMTGFYDDDDYKTEAKKRAVGAQPLAIQIKGRWYGLQGIGPIGMGLGMGATMYDEANKKGGDKLGGAARSAYASATEAPLLSSLKDLAKDAGQVKRDRANIGKLAGNLAASFVPSVIGDIGQAIPYLRDPNERQVKDDPKKVTGARRAVREGFGQIGAKIPGVRRMLPIKKDANGKPVTTEYPDFIDPFNSRPATGNLPQRKKGASRPFIPPAPRR